MWKRQHSDKTGVSSKKEKNTNEGGRGKDGLTDGQDRSARLFQSTRKRSRATDSIKTLEKDPLERGNRGHRPERGHQHRRQERASGACRVELDPWRKNCVEGGERPVLLKEDVS